MSRLLGFCTCLLALAPALLPAAPQQAAGPIIRLDPALDAIVSPSANIEKLAGGFGFLEGPVWDSQRGYLVFSDIPKNQILKWTPDGKVSVFLERSGFTGKDPSGLGRQQTNGHDTFYLIGSNGIAMDPHGRLVYSALGDRQVVRLEPDGGRSVLATHFEGKRLNGTNDLVYKSDGALYFTDPPSALREGDRDPRKELAFNGVYLLKDGELHLLTKEIALPNGIALSPDEKILYVNDTTKRNVLQFDIQPNDTIASGRVFVDMSGDPAVGNPDGMKVDSAGNVYCTGAGGIWIISPEGRHLGTIVFPERPSNLAFGAPDAKSLYVTARSGLYRIRLKIAGTRH